MERKDEAYCKCLYFSASALAREISKIASQEFAITGLSPSYAFLLMTINARPGISPTELSEFMLLTPSTVTRLIDKMEYRGFVRRQSAGKFIEVYPTEKSSELNDKIKGAWMNLNRRYSNAIGEEEAAHLTSMIYEARKKLV